MYNLPQKLSAEFIGAFAVTFFGAGAACADEYLRASNQGNLGLLGIALAHGLAMGVMVATLGHISGGHFNPAITIGFWATKKLGTVSSFLYGVAQMLGAIAGAYVLKAVIPETTWRPAALGAPSLAADITRTPGLAIEGFITFFLVFVFFAAMLDVNGNIGRAGGLAVGLTVTIGVLLAGPFTGAAMNPAAAFGPALATRHWTNQGVYWVGPLFGGLLGAWIYDTVLLRDV